jgi:hypothetical protein
MSKHYICKLQRLIFNFVWNSKSEPLACKTMYLTKNSGGLNIVNNCFDICNTLPIYHIFDEAKTVTAIYFSNKDKCLDFHKFNTFSNFA